MRAKTKTVMALFFGLVALAMVLVGAAGCGGDGGTTTSAYVCDKSAPSIIPKPTGRPQIIEFYRDT